jgi:glycosyltransferase involved in cell wall biosynthesis
MRFSIFTPSHTLKRIDRTIESVSNQTFKSFEWVFCLNNDALNQKEELKSKLQDKGITYKILEWNGPTDKIGALKKFCCSKSQGELLLELDHDDELSPDCLEEIDKAHSENNADFYYSDDIDIEEETGKSIAPYSEEYGWKYYKCERTGMTATRAFSPSPLSFGFIWYAPNHVRVWSRSFYESIGGHNEEMDVLDDHELLCRTYISGKVFHVQKPLYIYWRHNENTCYGDKNAKIQNLTVELHDRFIQDLCKKWSENNNLKKIDLCCHKYKAEGFLGVDGYAYENVDVVCNLDEPDWPFEDNSVGVFRMQDALEHLKDPIQTMKELYRCLAPNGFVLINVPNTDGRGAFQDPTHVSFWNSNSFWYYTKAAQAQFINTPVKFKLARIDNYYPSDFHQLHLINYTRAHLMKLEDSVVPAGGREI